jgi:hypothetical protein
VNKFFATILQWGKNTRSFQSSLPIGDTSMSSAKPTTVTIYYRDSRKEDTIECVYAKSGNGALQVAIHLPSSDRWQYRYIPFSNPDIDYIVVESEEKEKDSTADRSHSRPRS